MAPRTCSNTFQNACAWALMRTIGGMLVYAALVLALFTFTAHHPVAAALNVFLIGTTAAIGPALQVRLMDVAGDAQTLAAALNHSAFNVANAVGAWLGGTAIAAGLGWTATGWVGALLALAGLAVVAWALQHARAVTRAPQAVPCTDAAG